MAQSVQPGRFGHSGKPDDEWLSKQEKEPILEPELPIIDTHHHLWDRRGWTYLLQELLADLNTGHNIIATESYVATGGFMRSDPALAASDTIVVMAPALITRCGVGWRRARSVPSRIEGQGRKALPQRRSELPTARADSTTSGARRRSIRACPRNRHRGDRLEGRRLRPHRNGVRASVT
jgi:hypothetical protein